MLAGAGDELQGIKKGVLELADMVAVNKADGDNKQRAELAAAEYRRALHLLVPDSPVWNPPVVTCSGLTGDGVAELWEQVEEHRSLLTASGEREQRRRHQQLSWMTSMLNDRVIDRVLSDPGIVAIRHALEAQVLAGEIPVSTAVDRLIERLGL